MHFDDETFKILSSVIDDLLISDTFKRQRDWSAVEVEQCVLRLASRGERDALNIKRHVLKVLLAQSAARL
jgi:hypothetical protein